jgi:hypothetical protein
VLGPAEAISREVGYNRCVESNLSQKQRDILVGLLLGDGSLEFNGCRGTRLQIKQAAAKKEYVFWIYQQFADMVKTPPQQRPDTLQWYFGTRYRRDLEEIRCEFYRERAKVVPSKIADWIQSPISLAVWYMDDGRLDYREKSHYAYRLSTDSFTEPEVRSLQRILEERFDVSSSIQLSLCRGKRYPQLHIGKNGRDQFYKIVSPYILPCFNYKLPPPSRYLDPSETTRRAPTPPSGGRVMI